MPISAVDLFCGVGGLTHGLQLSGIPVVAGLDVEHSCQYAYEQNNNARFILSYRRRIKQLFPSKHHKSFSWMCSMPAIFNVFA